MSAEFQFDTSLVDSPNKGPMPCVKFYMKAVPHEFRSKEEGRPVCVDREYINIKVAGGLSEIDRPSTDEDRRRFSKLHSAWKEGQEAPLEGTPLDELTVLAASTKEEYRLLGVRTVEQLAAIPDSAFHRFGPGAREHRQKARNYLTLARDAGIVDRFASENEDLKKQIADLQEQIRDISSKFEKTIKSKDRKPAAAPDSEL